eukprot:GHRR01005545.1.p1 GENE.GHRR01005545.1~~GHRR01005545.1.p1  ORF type:complete len:193 (+),score=58.82 GHRR01005545.1:905-1483(+)
MALQSVRVAIIPGNAGGTVHNLYWYSWLKQQLHKPPAVTVALQDMPEPTKAPEALWIPFMRNKLQCQEDTIVVAHSSGSAAAMRFAERHRIAGLVLVGAYHTDLGDPTEAASGYFHRPWQWQDITKHAEFIVQFGSTDDPYLPWVEQQAVADALQPELYKYDNKGHFMTTEFPELLEVLTAKIEQQQQHRSV